MNLILSLFPGIDILGRGFELEGFCVVRGPDLILGQFIENFAAAHSRFDGVIGGSPCQNFSGANRTKNVEEGAHSLTEFKRVVTEAAPEWFLLENVPGVPDIQIEGYKIQRFFINAKDCGLRQSRNRRFQYGSRDGRQLIIEREPSNVGNSLANHTSKCEPPSNCDKPVTHIRRTVHESTCLASEGRRKNRRSFADFCELQGLPRDFDLPGWSIEMKYRFVGNAVALPVARCIARAIVKARASESGADSRRLCLCECGRVVSGRQITASDACRKRLQKMREATASQLAWSLTGDHSSANPQLLEQR